MYRVLAFRVHADINPYSSFATVQPFDLSDAMKTADCWETGSMIVPGSVQLTSML